MVTPPTATIAGLGSGLDVNSIVSQLMAIEQQPQTLLTQQKQASMGREAAWTAIGAALTSLQSLADGMSTAAKLSAYAATSSDPTRLTATTGATAQPGTVTLTVNQLATAQQQAAGGFAGSTAAVGAGVMTISSGLAALGLSQARAVAGTPTGAHTFTVGATGAQQVATSTAGLRYGAGGSFTVTASGQTLTATVAAGTTYATADDLVAALQAQLGSAVKVSQYGGVLAVTTTATGAAQTLQVSADPAFGFTAGAPASQGSDLAITVDGTSSHSLTATDYGTDVTVGALTVHVGSGVTAGTAKVGVAATAATATLADLTAQIQASGAPVDAAVFDTGDPTAKTELLLSAQQTGTAGALDVETSGFTGVPAFTTVTAAQDATLSMGSLTITRSSNTITDVLPGLTLTLVKADPASPVTVSTQRDDNAVVTKAQGLVSAINGALAAVGSATAYDATSGQASALTGDYSATGISNALYTLLGNTETNAGSSLVSLAQLGISVQKDGTYSLDETKLRAALQSNPTGVDNLLATKAAKLSAAMTADTQTGGVVAAAEAGEQAVQQDLQTQIDSWTDRLALIQQRYLAQFTALDTAMAQMKNQSGWLTSQLASLPTWSTQASSSQGG